VREGWNGMEHLQAQKLRVTHRGDSEYWPRGTLQPRAFAAGFQHTMRGACSPTAELLSAHKHAQQTTTATAVSHRVSYRSEWQIDRHFSCSPQSDDARAACQLQQTVVAVVSMPVRLFCHFQLG